MGKIIYEPKGRALEYAALAANIYSGCSHGCKYCFAPAVLHRERCEFHSNVIVRKGALGQLRNDVAKLTGDNRRVLMSFTTDPYQPIDEELKVTRDAIMIIKGAGLNLEILTKGGMRAFRDLDLLDGGDCVASTLTLYDRHESAQWEPQAAFPDSRIGLLMEAKKRGITTWASLEPVIDPWQTLELIKWSHEFVDLFKIGKLNYHKHANTIDWKKFGNDAVELLEKLGANHYIKMDLRGCME